MYTAVIQVVQNAVTHADNVYNIPNLSIEGRACQTNLPSNTAFRGFGAPQGMMIIEQVMARVSCHLKMPAIEVRELNMYHEGDATPYDMVLSNCTIRKCWEQLKETSSFTARRAAVDQFNKWANNTGPNWTWGDHIFVVQSELLEEARAGFDTN